MDGMDVALLRATVVDANGNPVLDATDNVTFTIKSGPGFIAGVGNGDPACQEPSQVRPIFSAGASMQPHERGCRTFM